MMHSKVSCRYLLSGFTTSGKGGRRQLGNAPRLTPCAVLACPANRTGRPQIQIHRRFSPNLLNSSFLSHPLLSFSSFSTPPPLTTIPLLVEALFSSPSKSPIRSFASVASLS